VVGKRWRKLGVEDRVGGGEIGCGKAEGSLGRGGKSRGWGREGWWDQGPGRNNEVENGHAMMSSGDSGGVRSLVGGSQEVRWGGSSQPGERWECRCCPEVHDCRLVGECVRGAWSRGGIVLGGRRGGD